MIQSARIQAVSQCWWPEGRARELHCTPWCNEWGNESSRKITNSTKLAFRVFYPHSTYLSQGFPTSTSGRFSIHFAEAHFGSVKNALFSLVFSLPKTALRDRLLFQQKISRKKIDFYIFNLPRFFAETQADPRPHFGRIFTKDESKFTQDMFGENATNPVFKNWAAGTGRAHLTRSKAT